MATDSWLVCDVSVEKRILVQALLGCLQGITALRGLRRRGEVDPVGQAETLVLSAAGFHPELKAGYIAWIPAYGATIRMGPRDMTERYKALCGHYGMEPSRNNRGLAHENGSIEGPHGHLKRSVADALALRGSSDFDDLDSYRSFIAEVVGRANAHRSKAIEAERATLGDLPAVRTADYEPISVNITSSSGFVLRRVFYTVPSRLIGHRLGGRIYDDRIELFLSGTHLMTLPRGRAGATGPNVHVVNYRHVIHSLKKKPMALLNLVYRDELFPREAYRRCFEKALEQLSERQACRLAVALLALAHEENCEAELATEIDRALKTGQLPDPGELKAHVAPQRGKMPSVDVTTPPLVGYGSLLSAGDAA